MLSASGDADLYVLPEMWSTGFVTEPAGVVCDEADNTALRWMRQTACERRCAICGSLAVRLPDGTYRNRFYFVDGREDCVSFYDKRHLFTHGGENRHYTAGAERAIVSYGGMRWLLLTCYDLRFPCWSRYGTGREYDGILLVANWPASRQPAWQILTRARAVENQCYLVGVNRVGDDPRCHYSGLSVAVDPVGRTLAQCRQGVAQAVTVTVDREQLVKCRQRFRVLDDRD